MKEISSLEYYIYYIGCVCFFMIFDYPFFVISANQMDFVHLKKITTMSSRAPLLVSNPHQQSCCLQYLI